MEARAKKKAQREAYKLFCNGLSNNQIYDLNTGNLCPSCFEDLSYEQPLTNDGFCLCGKEEMMREKLGLDI